MKKILIPVYVLIFAICPQTIAQTESDWILKLFNFSTDVTSISDDAISLSIDATWTASEVTGTKTTTGTLTQNVQGNWTYSASPSDKLVVIFTNGSQIEFKFVKIDGYTDGTADDFKESHSMDFTTYIENNINIRIVSDTGPVNGKVTWQRTITGNIILDGDNQSVNIQHNGEKETTIDNGFAFLTKDESVTGTSSSGLASYSVNDQFHINISHNSNVGQFAKDTQFWKNSSITAGNSSYAFKDLNVFFVGGTQLYDDADKGIYNQVINDYQWSAAGTLFKNDQTYGNVIFNTQPVNYTNGPYLIAKMNSGPDIILHYLLNSTPTDIADNSNNFITEYNLEQNYPNPFNPTTTIKYSIPVNNSSFANATMVTLKIYDLLGRETATLVNKPQQSGTYSVSWDAANKPSGIYFYRLKAGNFSKTTKMILQK